MSRGRQSSLSRRQFLAASGAVCVTTGCGGGEGGGSASGGAAGAAGSGGATGGSAGSSGGSGGATGGAGGTGGTSADAGSTALVGIGRGANVEDSVRRAVALTAGLSFITAGSTVLLKPNLNSGDPFPYSTNPEVVRAVITLLGELGVAKIIVADRSNPSYDTMSAMQTSGIAQVVKDTGVESMDLADHPFSQVSPATASHWPNGFEISSVLSQVDFTINLPSCKHHSMANFSMALKAWMGVITQSNRSAAHGDLGNRLPELHLAHPASFTILDATKACLTKGPFPGGAQASPGLIVATPDPIACDVTGLAILKHAAAAASVDSPDLAGSPWLQPQIVRALAVGIGIGAPAEYSALGDGVPELDELLALISA